MGFRGTSALALSSLWAAQLVAGTKTRWPYPIDMRLGKADVAPLLEASCLKCHVGTETTPLDLAALGHDLADREKRSRTVSETIGA